MVRGYSAIGLDNPKSNSNVASALRAAQVYCASMIAISGRRYSKHSCDTMKAYRHLPLLQVDELKSVIPYDCIPIAVDLIEGAIPLFEFKHPQRAFYIFGPEDGTLGKRITNFCKEKIYIPTKGCMNLAATINVVLYDRMSKETEDHAQT